MKIFPIFFIIASFMLTADDKVEFRPRPAASYPTKQTNDKVTIAAIPYDTEELAHTAFGKTNPNQYGVLPVLIVIQNDTDEAMRLSGVTTQFITFDNRQIDNTPAAEVPYLGVTPKRPGAPVELPIPIKIKKKNPLNAWEIEGRAFAAKMLPAHESASGFFYFQVRPLPGAKFYLTGIQSASSGKDVFYYEIPLDIHH